MQRCVFCQQGLDAENDFCGACGRPQPTRLAAVATISTPAPDLARHPCPACGVSLPAMARFCRNCGAAQPAGNSRASRPTTPPALEQPGQHCPACGGVSPAGAVFCGDCGKPLAALAALGQQAQPPSQSRLDPLVVPADGSLADLLATQISSGDTTANTFAGSRHDGLLLPFFPAFPANGAPTAPGLAAAPQVGAPQVPGLPAGPQVGAPQVPGIPAGPQAGAPQVPGLPAGPQAVAPHLPALHGLPQTGLPNMACPPGMGGGNPPFQGGIGSGGGASPGGIGGGGASPGGAGAGGMGTGGGQTPGKNKGKAGKNPTPSPALPPYAAPPAPARRWHIPRLVISLLVVVVALTTGVSAYLVVRASQTPQLTVASAQFKQACSGPTALSALTTSLTNPSGTALSWKVNITDVDPAGKVWAAVSPASGTLAPGQQVTLKMTPAAALCQNIRKATAPVAFRATLSYAQISLTLTDTVTPTPVVAFLASPTNVGQMCNMSQPGLQPLPAIPVTLDNSTSNVPVDWQIGISDTDPTGQVWAAVDTASGTLNAGQQQTITLTPIGALCLDIVGSQPVTYNALLSYTVSGKTEQMTLADTITPPAQVNNFQLSQTTFSQGCQSATSTLAPEQVTLDNSASTVAVNWQVAISDTDPAGQTWAAPDAPSGTVQAGQTATLTLSPISSLCQDMFFSTNASTYTATISDSALGQTNSMTVSDTVAPPPSVNNFAVSPTSYAQDCNATNPLPAKVITLDNTKSNVAVNWSVVPAKLATASPTSGTVPAGKTATLTLTPTPKLCTALGPGTQATALVSTISATALGQTQTINVADTVTPLVPVFNPAASPLTASQNCTSGFQLAGVTITLDNSGSNVAAQWKVSITDRDPAGTLWATATSQSGTVAAGTSGSLTITPFYNNGNSNLCNDLGAAGQTYKFTAVITLTDAFGHSRSFTLTDSVTAIYLG